jgi:hypothetical protein
MEPRSSSEPIFKVQPVYQLQRSGAPRRRLRSPCISSLRQTRQRVPHRWYILLQCVHQRWSLAALRVLPPEEPPVLAYSSTLRSASRRSTKIATSFWHLPYPHLYPHHQAMQLPSPIISDFKLHLPVVYSNRLHRLMFAVGRYNSALNFVNGWRTRPACSCTHANSSGV